MRESLQPNLDKFSQAEKEYQEMVNGTLLMQPQAVTKQPKYAPETKVLMTVENKYAVIKKCQAGICLVECIQNGLTVRKVMPEASLTTLH